MRGWALRIHLNACVATLGHIGGGGEKAISEAAALQWNWLAYRRYAYNIASTNETAPLWQKLIYEISILSARGEAVFYRSTVEMGGEK